MFSHVALGLFLMSAVCFNVHVQQGGGTFFEHMGNEPLEMDAGHATFRPGSVRHGGHTVTRGDRYIIGAFILIEDKVQGLRAIFLFLF